MNNAAKQIDGASVAAQLFRTAPSGYITYQLRDSGSTMLEFSANLAFMFGELPFLDRFEAAANCGFAAVEYLFPYDFSPAVIRGALDANHLTQALFNLPAGTWHAGDRGLAAVAGRQREFRQSVDTSLNYAKVTGVKRLHAMSGIACRNDPVASRLYVENLAYAADKLGEWGLDVLIEPINARDMPGYFLNDYAQALSVIEELGRPNLRLQFDVYHRQIIHGDVLRAIGALFPVIGHVQIASVPDRNEPNTGELNDDRILASLEQLGYRGYVGCEYRPAAGTADGLGWMRRWRNVA